MERITSDTEKLIFFAPMFPATEQEVADAERALSEKTGRPCILLDSYWDKREKFHQTTGEDYRNLKLRNDVASAELLAKLAAVCSLFSFIFSAVALLAK